ncbi:hypothetical protein [Nocardioides panacisoli]|uniref:Uncharacterized protein n=1 Tax=Nocardioides panacisoli TaxID=627624 RepID=A0ABP7ISU7_9ACTN
MNTITHRIATGLLATAAVGGLALAASAPANALSKSASTVTIQADGVDLSGAVSSSNPGCLSDRTVIVYKVVGTRGGGDDTRLASDTTGDDGSWNTGNTGIQGYFYAKVKANTTCGRAFSSTVHAVR